MTSYSLLSKISIVTLIFFLICNSTVLARHHRSVNHNMNPVFPSQYSTQTVQAPYGVEVTVKKYNEVMTVPALKFNRPARAVWNDNVVTYISTSDYNQDFNFWLQSGTDGYFQSGFITIPFTFSADNVDKILSALIIACSGFQPKTEKDRRKLYGAVYALHYNDIQNENYVIDTNPRQEFKLGKAQIETFIKGGMCYGIARIK